MLYANQKATLLAIATVIIMLLFGLESVTASDNNQQNFVVYVDIVGGPEILSGDYASAIAKMNDIKRLDAIKVFLSNNRCVAETLAKKHHKAKESCRTAVETAEDYRNYGDWFSRHSSKIARKQYIKNARHNQSLLQRSVVPLTISNSN